MLERTLRTDRTAVTSALPASTPAEDGKRAPAAEPSPENIPSSRHLAAGDYWFDNDSAQDGKGPNSRLHT
ncbi:isoamylase early set domain-containing protein [Streptomyces virginiae]